MESELAFKLGELLEDCEKREVSVSEREMAVRRREEKVLETEQNQKTRGEELTAESSRYQSFRDIETERRKNEEQARKNAKDAEILADERRRWARELEKAQEENRVAHVNLSGASKSIEEREQELKAAQAFFEKSMAAEKIAHRERVLKELAEIEQKKRGLI